MEAPKMRSNAALCRSTSAARRDDQPYPSKIQPHSFLPNRGNPQPSDHGMMHLPGRRPPISPVEFYDAFRSVWYPSGRLLRRAHRPARIGLAISGGLDSMSLAILCQKLKHHLKGIPGFRLNYRAFIVDHKARDGSTEEAELVSERLRSMGLDTTVLTLQWPNEVKPLQLADFESQARRLRYKALGIACHDHGIRDLFLAHHNDDQAETVMMRLANGHKGMGLQGIRSTAEIPECWGLYGVHQSGIHKETAVMRTRKNKAGKFYQQARKARMEEPKPLVQIEDGGITIHRPLLQFSKNRLEATCLHYRISWIEDSTNSDPTATTRNAIRHLLHDRGLPLALRKKSLLSIADRMHQKALARWSRADNLFRDCEFIIFDARSGGLVVRLPERALPVQSVPLEYRERGIVEAQYKASLLLRRLIEIVTPQEVVALQNLRFAVNAIFPEAENPNAVEMDKDSAASNFTVAGVFFKRFHAPLLDKEKTGSWRPGKRLDQKYIWLLSRQPYPATKELPTIAFPPQPKTVTHPPVALSLKSSLTPPSAAWSPWHLWDGRFWIRVSNSTSSPLIVRPLREQDLKPFRIALTWAQRQHFDELLGVTAPGKVRWTLPVLARADGVVVATPTLGVALDEAGVGWEVRYRKVDMGARREEVVVG